MFFVMKYCSFMYEATFRFCANNLELWEFIVNNEYVKEISIGYGNIRVSRNYITVCGFSSDIKFWIFCWDLLLKFCRDFGNANCIDNLIEFLVKSGNKVNIVDVLGKDIIKLEKIKRGFGKKHNKIALSMRNDIIYEAYDRVFIEVAEIANEILDEIKYCI